MIKLVAAIYDSKSDTWIAPMMFRSKGEAARSFEDALSDNQTSLNKHPEDYSMWYIADFDDTTGIYESLRERKELLKQGTKIQPATWNINGIDKKVDSSTINN